MTKKKKTKPAKQKAAPNVLYSAPATQAKIDRREFLNQKSGHYRAPVGLPEEKLNDDERAVLRVLRRSKPNALSGSEMASCLDGNRRRVSNALRRLVREGFIIQANEQKRGATYKATNVRARIGLMPEGVVVKKRLFVDDVAPRPEGETTAPKRKTAAKKAPAKTKKAPAKKAPTKKAPAKKATTRKRIKKSELKKPRHAVDLKGAEPRAAAKTTSLEADSSSV